MNLMIGNGQDILTDLNGINIMRIGFLRGSFDPIHVGHINMIRSTLNSHCVDKVIVVVSGHNPWKKIPPIAFEHRVEMCRIAAKPFGDKCEVSDIEGTFVPPFTANKPLNHFRELYKQDEGLPFTDSLYIIAGTDTVTKIPRWKNANEEILPYYGVICIKRPGVDEDIPSNVIKQFSRLILVNNVTLDISSTAIRSEIETGGMLYPLVPSEVEEYIKNNKLYEKVS